MKVRREPLVNLIEAFRAVKRDKNKLSETEWMSRMLTAIIPITDSTVQYDADPENVDDLVAQVCALRARAIALKMECDRLLRTTVAEDDELPPRAHGMVPKGRVEATETDDPQSRKMRGEFEEICALLENICLLSKPELIDTLSAAMS